MRRVIFNRIELWYSKGNVFVERGIQMSDSTPEIIENQELKAKVLESLETVIDPELGIDIVNIGLVYDVILFEDKSCEVRITLTTMGCPFADVIEDNIREAVQQIPEIKAVQVKLVWYPAWTPDKLSRYAKIALGIR